MTKDERAGARVDKQHEKRVEQRWTSGEEIPPDPVLVRQGDQPGAGANTPSGPFPNSTVDEAKRAKAKQDEIMAREKAHKDTDR